MTLGSMARDDARSGEPAHAGDRGRLVGVPRLSRAHLSRPRLLRALDGEGDGRVPLRVVQAPAGYGKTSLLAEWAHGRPRHARPVVWVTVDEDCGTRVGFWARVLGMLDVAGVAREPGWDGFTVSSDLAAILPVVLLRGFEALAEPVTLVVDSYENILDPAIETDLLSLVQHASSLSLVIGARAATAFASTSTSLSIDTAVLHTHDLAFTAAEAAQLAGQVGGSLTAGQVDALHRVSAGWPLALRAGVELPTERPWPSSHEIDPLSRVQRMLIGDLERIPGFDDLVILSVVDGFTSAQATALGVDVEGSPILAEVESRGLGGWDDGAGSNVPRFRVHLLVREALRAGLDDTRLQAVHRTLSSWYEAHENYGNAFESALVAHQWQRARDIAATHFRQVVASIERQWIHRVDVPKQALRSHPLLAINVAVARYAAGDVGKAVRILTASIATVEVKRLADHRRFGVDHVWAQGMLTLGLRFAGRDELVQPALRRFHTMLERVDDPNGELQHNLEMVANQTASTYIQLDRLDDAARVLTGIRPMRHAAAAAASHSFYSPSLTVLTSALSGRIAETRGALARLADGVLPRFFNVGFYAIPKHLGAALVHLEDHRLDAAEKELEQVRPHWPTVEMWPLVLYVWTLQQWHASGPVAALRTLEDSRAEKAGRPLGAAMRATLTALHSELLLAVGRPAEAARLIPSRTVRSYPRLTVARARHLLMDGNYGRALALTATREHEHRTTPRDRLHLRLIASAARLRSGDDVGATQSFEDAIDLASRTGLRSPFASMPRPDFVSLATAVRGGEALHDHVQRYRRLFPEPEEQVSLTKRELVVLHELTSSDSIPVIARRLSVSADTVKSQSRAIYRKLAVPGRADAVVEARRRGILQPTLYTDGPHPDTG